MPGNQIARSFLLCFNSQCKFKQICKVLAHFCFCGTGANVNLDFVQVQVQERYAEALAKLLLQVQVQSLPLLLCRCPMQIGFKSREASKKRNARRTNICVCGT